MGEGNSKPKQKTEGPEERNGNPINELQVLEGHTDIVRFLVKVDELRSEKVFIFLSFSSVFSQKNISLLTESNNS
jgi:hypothetical protein